VDYLTSRRIPIPEDLLSEKDITVELTRADIERMIAEQRAREQQAPSSDSSIPPNGAQGRP
jgi:hypothetical protein